MCMVGLAKGEASPKKGLVVRFGILIPLALVLALGSYLYVRPRVGTYTARTFYGYDDDELASQEVRLSQPGIVEVDSVERAAYGHDT